MPKTRLSSKGQIVIPKPLRDALHWNAGAELNVELKIDTITIHRADQKPRLPTIEEVRRVAGMLNYKGKTLTIKDMDEGVSAMFRKEWKK